MPIKAVGDRVVHFKDVAKVRRTYKDAETFARLNGRPALAIEVVQRTGANVISTISAVKALIEEERQFLPPSIEIFASRDKSKDVNSMLTELQNSVIAAVLLVFIIIIGILGFRSAALVGIAVPGSFLLGILAISAAGISINMMVLYALIMAVGMLVDGAIVVTELADRRMAEGETRGTAYSAAARRMSWPIIASTCTTLAAFVPLAFWPGMAGEFMKYLPITLIAVLSASLLMALLVCTDPGVDDWQDRCAGRKDHSQPDGRRKRRPEHGNRLTGVYVRFLRRVLRHPRSNVIAVTLLLVIIYVAFDTFGRGVEMFPGR